MFSIASALHKLIVETAACYTAALRCSTKHVQHCALQLMHIDSVQQLLLAETHLLSVHAATARATPAIRAMTAIGEAELSALLQQLAADMAAAAQ